MNLLRWTLSLAAIALAYGQPPQRPSEATDILARCALVNSTLQALRAGHSRFPDDLMTAGNACKPPSPGDSQFAQKIRDAGAALDRLKLTSSALFDRMEQSSAGLTGTDRFYLLVPLAKFAFTLGKPEKAQGYARELLKMASQYPNDWNYGNAIYYGYFVLGRVACEEGNVPLAKQYLMNSATTPGSPQLDTFGPNLTLAKELLEKGQFEVVGEFLTQCKNFWKMDHGNLDSWIAKVRHGEIPDFGANLDY